MLADAGDERTVAGHVTSRLFLEARKRPLESPVRCLARALGEEFCPYNIAVCGNSGECYLWDLEQEDAVELALADFAGHEDALAVFAKPRRGEFIFATLADAEGQLSGVRIGQKLNAADKIQVEPLQLVIVFLENDICENYLASTDWPLLRRKIDWFHRNLEALQMLFDASAGLWGGRALDQVAQQIAWLESKSEKSLSAVKARLFGVVKACKTWLRYGGAPLLARAAEAALTDLLGRGISVFSTAENSDVGLQIKALSDELRDALKGQPESEAIANVFESLVSDDCLWIKSFCGDLPQSGRYNLLALSCFVLRQVSLLLASRDKNRNAVENIRLAIRELASMLAEVLLELRSVDGARSLVDAQRCLPFRAVWLRLWFCHCIVGAVNFRVELLGGGSSRGLLRLIADLAYVVRDSAKCMILENRNIVGFDHAGVLDALRGLVEFHAREVVGVSKDLDFHGLLSSLGGISLGGGPGFATGHLQHVLDTYLVGQFLCELKIESAAGGELVQCDFLDLLIGDTTSPPGELRKKSWRRAFGLAAVLHDVGMVLFPYWTNRVETMGRVDDGAAQALLGVRTDLISSARQLLGRCTKELLEAQYIHGDESESRLRSFLERVTERGLADHCVLGAWYLDRVCSACEDLSRDVREQAVRAVLLHRIVTQTIDADGDSVASMLVLCDELAMWIEEHEPQPDRFERIDASSFREHGVAQTPFAEIVLNGLVIERTASGLSCFLRQGAIDGSREDHGWPEFEVTLKDGEQLPLPVFRLWLRLSQNLGRIRSSRSIFTPIWRVRSRSPRSKWGMSTKEMLERVVELVDMRLKRQLDQWLSCCEFEECDDGFEKFTVKALLRIATIDFDDFYLELERGIKTVLEEERRTGRLT